MVHQVLKPVGCKTERGHIVKNDGNSLQQYQLLGWHFQRPRIPAEGFLLILNRTSGQREGSITSARSSRRLTLTAWSAISSNWDREYGNRQKFSELENRMGAYVGEIERAAMPFLTRSDKRAMSGPMASDRKHPDWPRQN
jgi:hypothetical protein